MRIGTRLAAFMAGSIVCGLAFGPSSLGNSAFGQSALGQSSPDPEDVRVMAGRSDALRAERELFGAVNDARRNQGLAPLHWNDSLAAAARRHAAVMAEHGSAQHGFEGELSLSARVKQTGAHFVWLSENVTQGPRTEFIHATIHEVRQPSRKYSGRGHEFDWRGRSGTRWAALRSRRFCGPEIGAPDYERRIEQIKRAASTRPASFFGDEV